MVVRYFPSISSDFIARVHIIRRSVFGCHAADLRARESSLRRRSLFFSEVHPLLGVKGDGKSKKKTAGRPKGSKGKDKDFPFRPKPYKGEQPSFSVETLSGSGLGGGGGMKGRAEGGLATGKCAPAAAESGSCADPGCLQGNPTPSSLCPFLFSLVEGRPAAKPQSADKLFLAFGALSLQMF